MQESVAGATAKTCATGEESIKHVCLSTEIIEANRMCLQMSQNSMQAAKEDLETTYKRNIKLKEELQQAKQTNDCTLLIEKNVVMSADLESLANDRTEQEKIIADNVQALNDERQTSKRLREQVNKLTNKVNQQKHDNYTENDKGLQRLAPHFFNSASKPQFGENKRKVRRRVPQQPQEPSYEEDDSSCEPPKHTGPPPGMYNGGDMSSAEE